MPINRVWRLGRIARGGSINRNQIVSVTDFGGLALYTTALPHGLTESDTIAITGVSNPAYNTALGTQASNTPNTFTVGGMNYVGDAFGGSWTIV